MLNINLIYEFFMNKIINNRSFQVLIIIISCKKDKNLRDSIFIEDFESPGLPIYSEWGYNTLKYGKKFIQS